MVNNTTALSDRAARQHVEQWPTKLLPSNSFWIQLIFSLAALLPFWTVQYPVMADYPNHLARWFVLYHMRDAAFHFPDLYAPAWGLLPYISPDVLAMALQLVLPIDIVGRCVLSLAILVSTVGSYFFLSQACPENITLALFAVVLALNPNFLMGSISYEFSIGFCLIAVGLWIRYCRRPTLGTGTGIVFCLILTYLSHLVGFFVAGLVMGVYALFQENRWRKLATLATLSIPALLLFVGHPIQAGGGAAFVYTGLTPWIKLKNLSWPLRLYISKTLDLLFLVGVASLLLLVVFKFKALTLRIQPVWLAVGASVLLVYFAAPAQYGLAGAFMDVRFLAFVFLFSLAAVRFGRFPRFLYIGLAILLLFRVATVEQLFRSQQPELKKLTASFEMIPRNAKVLPIVPLPNGTVMGKGYVHHFEYGITQRGFLDPVLFHLQGIQPLRLAGSPYCPNIYCDPANATEVNWQEVENSFDYLWVSKDPAVTESLNQIGTVFFANDSVTIYRIQHR